MSLITWVFCRYLHLLLMYSGRLQKDLLSLSWAEHVLKRSYCC